MRAIITVIGKDKVGIIAGVSGELSSMGVNILDISQTIIQEYFTMIMLVDIGNTNVSFEGIKDALNKKGEELGVSIRVQHEEIFESMHRI